MGRLFLVDLEFDDDDDQYFHGILVCRACHTHIAAFPHYLGDFELPDKSIGFIGPKFSKVVNVHEDGPENHQDVGSLTLSNVYCVKCGDRLGVKYIKDTCTEIEHVSNAGCYHMPTEKLNLWDGEIYSDIHDPPN